MNPGAQSVEFVEYFPKDFFRKEVNEPFIKRVIGTTFNATNWKQGNPNCFEPDYFCNGVPFEFTLASDKKKKNNFIQKYQQGKYTSDDVENDVIDYLKIRIADKAKKHYSVSNVHLCVLCVLNLFDWVSDEYGSYAHELVDCQRRQFFGYIREKYIDTNKFSNIFFIIPDLCAKWWVFDVLSGKKAPFELSDNDIQSGRYPFIILKGVYEQLKQN